MDKENSQLSVLSHLMTPGPLSAPGGKVFQSGGAAATLPTPGRTLGSKSFFPIQGSTPRRALGDVKNTVTPGGNKTGLALKPAANTPFQKPAPLMKLSGPEPASKPPRPKQQDRQKLVMKKPEPKMQLASQNVVEPVERMDLYEDEEDDFEDIWAAKERPAAYVQQLKNWRPSHLLPVARTQQEEEEWERQLLESDDDEEEVVSRVQNLTVEEPGCDLKFNVFVPEVDFGPLDHIALPVLDDLFCLDHFTFQ